MQKGKILVVSGPSGVGKTTLYKRLLTELTDSLTFSVSATTRQPRPGEINGKDYYFLSREEFEKKIAENEFVEWAQVYVNYYGTLKSEIERIVHSGKNCFLDIDVQGGMNVKRVFPESILIFVAPPSVEDLRNRIEGRNQNTREDIEIRMAEALHELSFKDRYDRIIINDEVERAYAELKSTVLEIIG